MMMQRSATQTAAASGRGRAVVCLAGRGSEHGSRRALLLSGAGLLAGAAFDGRPAVAEQIGFPKGPTLLDLPGCIPDKQSKGSGIKWCDRVVGTGEEALTGDGIKVDYTARAVDGTGNVFDGSRNFKFALGNEEILPGWEKAILGDDDLPTMREGGTRTIIIPPELAYGKEGNGCLYGLASNCRVPPNSPVEITFRYQGTMY